MKGSAANITDFSSNCRINTYIVHVCDAGDANSCPHELPAGNGGFMISRGVLYGPIAT